MLCAYNNKGDKVIATELSKEDRINEYFLDKEMKYKAMLKTGDINIHHFSAYPKQDVPECFRRGETDWHLSLKEEIYDLLKTEKCYKPEIEYRFNNSQIYDVFDHKNKFAVEIQSSKNLEKCQEKETKYIGCKKGITFIFKIDEYSAEMKDDYLKFNRKNNSIDKLYYELMTEPIFDYDGTLIKIEKLNYKWHKIKIITKIKELEPVKNEKKFLKDKRLFILNKIKEIKLLKNKKTKIRLNKLKILKEKLNKPVIDWFFE